MSNEQAINETETTNAVQKLESTIASLAKNWETMTLPQRAQQVARLQKSGISNRALAKQLVAKQLKVSECTIRRLIHINALSQDEKTKIERGESAQKVLVAARERGFLQEARNKKDLIELAKKAVLQWLDRKPLCRPDALLILSDIKGRLCPMDERDGLLHPVPGPLPSEARKALADVEKLIRRCRPKEKMAALDFWLNYYIDWGERWIAQITPAGDIRDEVFRVARLSLELGRAVA
jgi:hypothetical protein